jgi:hypothetical protein
MTDFNACTPAPICKYQELTRSMLKPLGNPSRKWHEVFCHGRPIRNCQRPFLAGEDDDDHQYALAKAERKKIPLCGRLAEWAFLFD